MKRKSLFVAAGLALAGLVAFGAVHHGVCSRLVNARIDRYLDDLHVNDAQRAQLHGLTDGLLAQVPTLQAGHDAARAEALAQWNQAQPDPAKVHALVDARVDAFRGLAHQVADAALKAHEVLTPAQRARVAERLAQGHP